MGECCILLISWCRSVSIWLQLRSCRFQEGAAFARRAGQASVRHPATLTDRHMCTRGNFGVVRRATIRRKNLIPAQYVAVKELMCSEHPGCTGGRAGCTIDAQELVEEAMKMLEIPSHDNVVAFLGATRRYTILALLRGALSALNGGGQVYVLRRPSTHRASSHS